MGMSSMPHRISNRVCAALLSGSAVWIQPRSVEAKKVIYITQLIYTLGGMSLVSLQVLEDRCLQLSTPPSHGALIGLLVSNLDKKGQGLNEHWNWMALTVADPGASVHWSDRIDSRAVFSFSCPTLCRLKGKFRIPDSSLLFVQGT